VIYVPAGAPRPVLAIHSLGLAMDLPSVHRSCGEIGVGEGIPSGFPAPGFTSPYPEPPPFAGDRLARDTELGIRDFSEEREGFLRPR